MIPVTYAFLIVAVGVAIVAEVLVAYKKYQMKKQFVEELDEQERNRQPPQN